MKMKLLSALSSRLGKLLATAAAVFAIGMLNPPAVPPAVAAAPAPAPATPVPVDQSPLTLRQPIPPNITLMLDDSGSMNWDFMPDLSFLTGATTYTDESGNPSAYVSIDPLRSSTLNGTYYNPATTYTAPPTANGTAYPTPTGLGSAYNDPYSSTSTTMDMTTKQSPWLCDFNPLNNQYQSPATSGLPCPASIQNGFPYYTAFPSATSGNNSAVAPASLPTPCPTGYRLNSGYCFNTSASVVAPTCPSSYRYNPVTWYCEKGTPTYTYLFTYATPGATAGTYVQHYVGKTSADCSATGVPASSCVADSATQQNVATWFSYYRKRLYLAKAGVMKAFNTLNPSFRLGFGSINGNNDSALSNKTGTTPNIQQVAAFDTNCAASSTCTKGASGTTRAQFWNWIAGESASGGTPLRVALDQVGQYYQTSQPWVNLPTDPTATSTIACRQAYAILTTDGFWNETNPPTTPKGASDTASATIQGSNNQSYTYTAPAPFKGGDVANGDASLADVAMYYWKTDLQPNLANDVPISTNDPAFWQHMTTFTIGLGFAPTGILPTGTTVPQIFQWANGNANAAITGFSWPTPDANSINNIADLAHAGVNGHGEFVAANDTNEFTAGLRNALNRATDRVGTGASLAANSTQLQTGTAVFQANYYTANWKGDLKDLSVDPSSGKVATTSTWSAEKRLQDVIGVTANGVTTFAARNILSYNTATKTFVAFKNTNDASGNPTVPPALAAAQLTALGPDVTTQGNIVNYLRGDNTLEQQNGTGPYRNRDWALGDIVDSQPVYEGPPNPNEFVNEAFAGYTYDPANPTSGVSPFELFAIGTTDSTGAVTPSAASKRTPLVWVAGNDGMLHAFNASTGNEVYAYLPGALMVNSTDPVTGLSQPLANLANPSYGSGTFPHQYYNDGELTIADAYVQLAGDSAPQWHSILVGTTGRGPARAVYALDVTDPGNITPLWERYAGDSSSGSDYIGQMVGKPTIAQTSASAPAWSVLIGNGYNSTQGKAALLQFDLASGALSVHQTDSTTSNGLAAPLAWLDTPGSGLSDVAYAGDLFGRVWSFTLITASGGNGNNPIVYTSTPTSTGVQLFTATNSLGTVQPITGGMWAGQNPKDKSVWLFFGTGKYLTQPDVLDVSVQSWYGIMAQSSAGSGPLTVYSRTSNSMVSRSIIAEVAGVSPTLGARAVTLKPATDDMSGKQGWVMDLTSPNSSGTPGAVVQGERMVTPDQFQGNLLIGTTRIPKPAGGVVDPCNPAGTGWIMAVDPFTGTNPQTNFFDLNGDGTINSSDMITVNGKAVAVAGVGFTSLPNAPIFVGVDMLVSFDNGSTTNVKTAASSGAYSRVSWEEVVIP